MPQKKSSESIVREIRRRKIQIVLEGLRGEIMKRMILFLALLAFIIISCSDPTSINEDLEFSEMEIHYTKYGGWIHTSKLDIFSDGLVLALELKNGSPFDTLGKSSKYLDEKSKEKLSDLFRSFSSYDAYYAPGLGCTDGNEHIIVFIYKGNPDTVNVYEPQNANIPKSLELIIQEMENIWLELLY
jgi:hypothetical protein